MARQSPVSFTGTIRSNLDPFDRCNDKQLWRVLEVTHDHLKDFLSGLRKGLDHQVTEGRENLKKMTGNLSKRCYCFFRNFSFKYDRRKLLFRETEKFLIGNK